jgi:exosortase
MDLESPSSKKARFRYSGTPATPLSANGAGVALEPLPAADAWRWLWVAMVTVGVGMWFLYAVNFDHLVLRWTRDAGWSHGFVVPLIALFFIRNKWEVLRLLTPSGSMAGFAVVLVAVVGQVLFRATGVEHMSFVSLPLFFFGLVLFVFGWEYLKILWLPIGYLVFALPPPESLYVRLTQPMQSIAAELGVQLLTLLGGVGERTGTVIYIVTGRGVTVPLQVAEACSGMRLLVAFFALAVALGYTSNRPMWQKVVLALCALPIAILCNGLRVTLTGLLVAHVSESWGHGDAHGFFGLTMLVPALLLQLFVGWVLDRLFIEEPELATGRTG